MRGISKVLALSCLVLPVACTSMPAPRVSASRTCGPCVQECAHGGPQLHVATTGDDRNPGTERAPWRTIQKAMNAATTGATVHIAAGTYAERLAVNVSGSPDSCITFQPLGFVVPAGGCGGRTGVACGGDEVVVDLAPFGSPVTDGVPFLAIDGRSHVRIQGLTFQDYTTFGPMQQGVKISGGASDVAIVRNRFLRLRTTGAHGANNALLTFWVWHPATKVTVYGNEIGEIVSGFGEALTSAANDVLIEDNWIHDTDGIGIDLGTGVGTHAASANVVRGNLVEWAGRRRDGRWWYEAQPAAVYADGATHSLIEDNTVRDSGYAFGVDAELGDRWPSHGLVIRNNLAHRNYAGIKVGTWYSDTDGSRVYDVLVINNTVARCDYGLVVRPYVPTTVAWENNLVARALVSFVNTGRWPAGTVDYNLYFGGGVGPDEHVVTLDPRFVDADAGNFSLGVGSPAIDAGDPATSADDAGNLDHAGSPRVKGGRIDLGAFEH